jgi:hypothetical protein
MCAISVDDARRINDEFASIAREAEHLSNFLATAQTDLPATGSQEYWSRTRVCASAAENIYTGLERVMAKIAQAVDGEPIPHEDGWHKNLLLRLSRPHRDVRGPVISPETYALFDKLRSFRHRVRMSYAVDLKLEIVIERCGEAIEAVAKLQEEVQKFL